MVTHQCCHFAIAFAEFITDSYQVESSTTDYQFAILHFTRNVNSHEVLIIFFFVRLLVLCCLVFCNFCLLSSFFHFYLFFFNVKQDVKLHFNNKKFFIKLLLFSFRKKNTSHASSSQTNIFLSNHKSHLNLKMLTNHLNLFYSFLSPMQRSTTFL